MSIRRLAIVALLLVSISFSCAVGCAPKTPAAQFTANATAGYEPLSVWFTDLSNGEIDSWAWDFEDDGIVDSQDQNVMHIYKDPGNYTVKLTVKESGRTDSRVRESYITVSECEGEVDFVAEPTACSGPTEVQFTDLSTGDVTGWAWDLNGDGVIDSTVQNPAYTYSKNGQYSVTLTVTRPGCSERFTKENYISVSGCST